jgi:hypothetical protein
MYRNYLSEIKTFSLDGNFLELLIGDVVSLYYYTQLDGVNEYVYCNHSASLDVTNTSSVTWGGWFYINNLSSSMIFLSKFTTPSLGILFYHTSIAPNKLSLVVYGSGSSTTTVTRLATTANIPTSQWVHLAFTKNSSDASASSFNIYINGISQTLTTIYDTLGGRAITNTSNFIMGAYSAGLRLNGDIDEVSIYNSELTASEMLNIYNLGRKNPILPTVNLISHWRMDAVNPTDEQGTNNGIGVNIDDSNIIEWI